MIPANLRCLFSCIDDIFCLTKLWWEELPTLRAVLPNSSAIYNRTFALSI